jgi:hypothetical protein
VEIDAPAPINGISDASGVEKTPVSAVSRSTRQRGRPGAHDAVGVGAYPTAHRPATWSIAGGKLSPPGSGATFPSSMLTTATGRLSRITSA